MDRLIALLAALVGLIALAGAVAVEMHGENERAAVSTELAELKASLGAVSQPPPAAARAPVQVQSDPEVAKALLALQARIVVLEKTTEAQAAQIAAAANAPPAAADLQVAEASPPADAATQPPAVSSGPASDCIPLGTRFMAESGTDYPICKTDTVIKVSDISDGTAVVDGAGPIAAGGFGKLGFNGCTVMVFSADTSGFAEMRVTCQ